MTAANLSGHDLDVAVARALGTFVRRYSTEPATLDEMLAWLCEVHVCSSVNFGRFVDCHPGKPDWVWYATLHYRKPDPRLNITRHGRTLCEAVARLVVAVEEAMGDGMWFIQPGQKAPIDGAELSDDELGNVCMPCNRRGGMVWVRLE